MIKQPEKRDIKISHDIIRNIVSIGYERTIELNPDKIPGKINMLTAQIAQMEYHLQRLGEDILSAKKELQLLQQLLDSLQVTNG